MTDLICKSRYGRRNFIKLCMGAVTAGHLRQSIAAENSEVKKYNQVELVDFYKKPITTKSLEIGRNYIFHYPFVTTPCFLIDLGEPIRERVSLKTENGGNYTWHGGVGPNSSIVAFSAICAHKMTHPAKAVSFINYRHGTINYQDKNMKSKEGSRVIYCCSEKSVYDVKRGAEVLGGPAKQPLTTIMLEYDQSSDRLYAVGTTGGELYSKFFETFLERLQLEYLTTEVNRLVDKNTELVLLEKFSKSQMRC
ncbi:MAG: hypothetical protein QNI91_12900 [Arenicellales bacterium]|nr:hypothetical protein [Arenicellales bacterium]